MQLAKYVSLFLLLLLSTVSANIYYVDQNHASASDTNPGTEDLPFKTIQDGINAIFAGDTLMIKGDTDSSVSDIYNVSGNGITTKRDGSSGSNIVIKAYAGHTVIIDGDGTGDGIELNNSYHEFHGITFTDFNKATEGSANKKGLLIDNCEFNNTKETGLRLRNIDGLIIRDTYIHHCFESGISLRGCRNVLLERVESSYNSDNQGASGDGDGFHTLDGENINFINCTAIGNSEDGFDITSGGELKNCISANHTACNVKLWRRDDDGYAPKIVTIVNSLIYGAGECGIKITNGPELRLFNNVIYNNGETGVAFRAVTDEAGPAVVTSYLVNNIITGGSKTKNWASAIDVRQSGNNFNQVLAGNNLYHRFNNTNNGLDRDEAFVNEDPQFKDAANADFHLEAASPAINKGTTEEEYNTHYDSLEVDVSLDFDGNARPKHGAYDMGAYETDVATGVKQSFNGNPSKYSIHNYPNPFNPATNIQFELPESSHVKLEIYNNCGEQIVTLVDEIISAGQYKTEWNGKNSKNTDVVSGAYYCRLITGDRAFVSKMILLR